MNEVTIKDVIRDAADYLLQSDLREENGYSKEYIELLRKVIREEFDIIFKTR